MRKAIWALLATACGGNALKPGVASISGAASAAVPIQTARVRCCTPGGDCLEPCKFAVSSAVRSPASPGPSDATLDGDLIVEAKTGAFSDTTGSYLKCYAADLSPSSAQLAAWDVQPGKQGTFSLNVTSLVPDGQGGSFQLYTVHGTLHAQCKPTDVYGPGNPATGTVALDLEF